jgi:pimeloyl-ACP methyl ester carboxylesterase
MKRIARFCLVAVTLVGLFPGLVVGQEPKAKGKDEFDIIALGRRLKGRIIDHTGNHSQDNRIWSRSLHQWRDLYIYVPPGFTRTERYPIMIYLHPFAMDERTFLRIVPAIDEAIACGKLSPMIVAAPDGAIDGRGCLEKPGSFFLNSDAGAYEDFVLQDVWDFMIQRYPIRPERNAHVLAGMSMGGFAAFNLGIRHRDAFGIVVGINPPLNLRWADVDGNPRAKFDPRRWGWRTGFDNPHEIVANFGGAFKVRMGNIIRPVFGAGDEALVNIAANNPLELAMKTGLRNGELSMFVGYGGRDEYNIDAQVESFLYYAKFRGLGVAVAFEPDGRHDGITAMKFMPAVIRWLGPQLEPFAPGRLEAPSLPQR